MEFFDCNASYGKHIEISTLRPVNDMRWLLQEMEKAGVNKAMVWRVEQAYGAGPNTGNEMLADDIKGAENLYGIWSLVPSHTHEIPDPGCMLKEMKKKRIFGWRLFPSKLRFLPKVFVLRDWLQLAVESSIPVFINTAHGTSLEGVAELLEKYPELTVVLCDPTMWPNDRYLRPFITEYPNVYLDLTFCATDAGIQSFVNEYGGGRLLYGSGFPESYFGSNMMMVKHAEISEEDREAIAAGNMERILRGVRFD